MKLMIMILFLCYNKELADVKAKDIVTQGAAEFNPIATDGNDLLSELNVIVCVHNCLYLILFP